MLHYIQRMGKDNDTSFLAYFLKNTLNLGANHLIFFWGGGAFLKNNSLQAKFSLKKILQQMVNEKSILHHIPKEKNVATLKTIPASVLCKKFLHVVRHEKRKFLLTKKAHPRTPLKNQMVGPLKGTFKTIKTIVARVLSCYKY